MAAALFAQCALLAEPWPDAAALAVRMALHSGDAELRDGDYFGQPLNRVARLLAIGHGKQILLSGATSASVAAALPADATLKDRGRHRLKDLREPESVFQLCHPALPAELPPLRSLSTHANNLPQEVSSFIGREFEIAQIATLLARGRALTLTGAGGCGKTRLATHVAANALEAFADGAFRVELAALTEPSLVAQAVASVLDVKEVPGQDLTQTLCKHLAAKQLLLILDNAEHLLSACARLAESLLRQCPRLVLLTSSREALGIAGETTYRVPSLSTPEPAAGVDPASLATFESVRLFTDRVQLHQPHFAVTPQNARALASICHRLDGIPLALELAASRMRAMSVEELNQRLDHRFRLLTGGARTALPRHQTLRSLIDWSYDLLVPSEQSLLCRLAVFSGGWTVDAAVAVCAESDDDDLVILDRLTSLADKSLVALDERDGVSRYRLLETVRHYAIERLMESEGSAWRHRHLSHFLALAESAESKLAGPDQQAWLDLLEGEHDNLRAALAWSSAVDTQSGLRLAGMLFQFWFVRGYISEARSWYTQLLDADACTAPATVRAKALNCAGVMVMTQCDYAAARTLFEESLALRRALGDRAGITRVLNNLGTVAFEQGDYAKARALHEEVLELRRILGVPRDIAFTLTNLGNVAREFGDFAGARALYEETVSIYRELGERRGIAIALLTLGNVAFDERDLAAARSLYEESVALYRELEDRQGSANALTNLATVVRDQGDPDAGCDLFAQSVALYRQVGDRRGLSHALEGLADVAFALGESIPAARIWGGATRLREVIGAPLPPSERPYHDRCVAAARTAVDDDNRFDAAWQEGSAMALEALVAYALAVGSRSD